MEYYKLYELDGKRSQWFVFDLLIICSLSFELEMVLFSKFPQIQKIFIAGRRPETKN